jgi:hypothetical protein
MVGGRVVGTMTAGPAGAIVGGGLGQGAAEAGIELACDGTIDPVKVGINTLAGAGGAALVGPAGTALLEGGTNAVVTGAVANGAGAALSDVVRQSGEIFTDRRPGGYSLTEFAAATGTGAAVGTLTVNIAAGVGAARAGTLVPQFNASAALATLKTMTDKTDGRLFPQNPEEWAKVRAIAEGLRGASGRITVQNGDEIEILALLRTIPGFSK